MKKKHFKILKRAEDEVMCLLSTCDRILNDVNELREDVFNSLNLIQLIVTDVDDSRTCEHCGKIIKEWRGEKVTSDPTADHKLHIDNEE